MCEITYPFPTSTHDWLCSSPSALIYMTFNIYFETQHCNWCFPCFQWISHQAIVLGAFNCTRFGILYNGIYNLCKNLKIKSPIIPFVIVEYIFFILYLANLHLFSNQPRSWCTCEWQAGDWKIMVTFHNETLNLHFLLAFYKLGVMLYMYL